MPTALYKKAKDQKGKTLEDQKGYCQRFQVLQKRVPDKYMNAVERASLLLRGLAPSVSEKVYQKAQLDGEDPATFRDFAKIMKVAKKFLDEKIGYQGIAGPVTDDGRFEEIAESYRAPKRAWL
ncbi:hypothetical protein H2203_006967 [Taxawa tesnikishii (nom. ined.)]|nr:hypothetical protein H2203_006967 [Dothideales sp. JES 119]